VIEKGAVVYSSSWNSEKVAPRIIVIFNESFAFLKFFFIISWWDHVIVTPEDKRRIVFNRGILIGLKGWMKEGGQFCPSSIVGESLLWKKAQKNETKNRISDAMNRIIPVFSPSVTFLGWAPCIEASR